MRRFDFTRLELTAALLLSVAPPAVLFAQAAPSGTFVFDHASDFTALSDGLQVTSGSAIEQITALRDDILRVRITPRGSMPEDASWAVLETSRQSSVRVAPDTTPEHVGFRTHSLIVLLDRKTMRLTVSDLSGKILQQDAQPVRFDGSSFRIFKSMPLDEHYFGLGDKTGPLDRREQAFSLWNTDAYRFQESTDPIYKAIPFFLTYRAGTTLGILLDNTWRTSFDFGRETSDIYSFGAADGPLSYYILYGPAPKQVVEDYAWLTGKPPLPPMWAFGFQQSRYSYAPQSRVLEVAQRFRTNRIPADAIYLDIGFQEKNRPFTVDKDKFPDLPGMVAQLKQENFHVVAITDLHIANLPNHNYAPYDTGVAGHHFVTNPDGSVYTGIVWPGPSVFPDFTRQQTRAWWGGLYKDFERDGIEGFWNDMNEPSVFNEPAKTMPLSVLHHIDEPGFQTHTATHAEIHNVYGMENSRATFDGLLKLAPDQRPFVLTRATYAGGQRYAATWTGDNSSTWNHLRLSTPMIENLGLSGFAYTGADVGGYAGSPPQDLLTKWLEVAAFQPIDRDHTEMGTLDQEPWAGGAEPEAIRRRYIETRYRLMTYLYTLAEETSRTGLPMTRPLFLEFPDAATDHHPLDIDIPASGEFMLGSDLLIAPSPWPEEPDVYQAEFPAQNWYDFWSGKRALSSPSASTTASSAATLSIQPSLETLPVFVRGGAILPIAPLVQSTNEVPQGPLTVRVFKGSGALPCSGSLYLDDGKTYKFRRGEYLRMQFTCSTDAAGVHVNISAHEGTFPAWWKQIRVELYGWDHVPTQLLIDDKVSPASTITAIPEGTSFVVSDDGAGVNLELR
ncbi:MAG: DUF5110 domain-containing protein [Acidobacteriota bacterium]|nr:DUF5110 domain-containing protein [Acidobacteriota bacterium]